MGNMPTWISDQQACYVQANDSLCRCVDLECFSPGQQLAYEIVCNKYNCVQERQLLFIVTGGMAGTDKSYLICYLLQLKYIYMILIFI